MPTPVATQLQWDGFSTLEQGMNNGSAPHRLGTFQASLLINATTRGDFATQRPGLRRIMTVLARPPGMFQHLGAFRTDAAQQFLIAVVAGRFYRIDPIAKTVAEITIPGDANPSTLMRGWSTQAECFWLYNDGQTRTFIWNGGTARRADLDELGPGTVLSYVQGRVWYALPDGLSFRATDLVGNEDSGTWQYDYRDSVLHETENTYLNEGGNFRVPADCGEITAMAATSLLDTSQGQGPLQVLCERNGFSVNTPVDRTTWKNVTYPIQTTSLIGAGCSGAMNTVAVNGDLFFRAPDGIRSFIIARRLFRDWGNTPQSWEMSGLLKYDQPDLLKFGSSSVYDNRYFTTLSPAYSSAGVYHRGFVAIDLAPISSIQAVTPPVYDGLWTGLNVLAHRQTEDGNYILSLADDGSIELWAMTEDELFDDIDGRVQWTVVPRSLFVERDAAGRPAKTLKKLETADLEYDQVNGLVNFKMSWKPDAYPCPTVWAEWQDCVSNCFTTPDCSGVLVFNTGYQPRKRLPEPPDVCAEGAYRPLRNFYTLNTRLDITGPARLLSARFGASLQQEPKYDPNTCDLIDCVPIKCCDYDPFTYKAKGQGVEPYGSGYGSGSGSGGSGGGGGGDDGGDTPITPPSEPRGDWNDITEIACTDGIYREIWQPTWTSPAPDLIGPRRVGVSLDEYGNGCLPGVLDQWMTETWAKWQAEKAANGIVVTSEQLVWVDTGSDSDLGFYANTVFTEPTYWHPHALHWRWEIWVEFCRATTIP